MFRIKKVMLVILGAMLPLGAGPLEAVAQRAGSDPESSFLFRFDNDVLAGTDRGYTGGAALSWLSGSLSEPDIPSWLQRIPGARSPEAQVSYYYTLSQNLYTPDDIRQADLIPTDRPYAGLTHVSVGVPVRHDGHEDAFELTVGIAGPASGAEWSHKLIHALIDDIDPQGWHNQIGNEPLLQLSLERRWKNSVLGTPDGFGLEIIPHLGGGVGNMAIYSSAGLHARAGWSLPGDFGPGAVRPGGQRWVTADEEAPYMSVFIYGGLDGKAVLTDLVLDGNTFRDSHRVEKKPWTTDFILGIEANRGRIGVGYELVKWSRRFTGESREQLFSSFVITVR